MLCILKLPYMGCRQDSEAITRQRKINSQYYTVYQSCRFIVQFKAYSLTPLVTMVVFLKVCSSVNLIRAVDRTC